jgi:hypothetical protein
MLDTVILGELDSCDITQRVYLAPPTIYNFLGEQCNCYITHAIYLVPSTIYNILGEQEIVVGAKYTVCVM